MTPPFSESWFYAPLEPGGHSQPFPAEEAHHALHVLRLQPGREIVVSDGQGRVWHCRLEGDREKPTVRILSPFAEPVPKPRLSLAIALLKGRDCEEPIAAACELPLADVHLLITDHCQVFNGQDHEKLLARLRQKSLAALKQARKPYLTAIHAPRRLDEWQKSHPDLHLVLAHPGMDVLPEKPPQAFALLIGPEGGFSEREIQWLQSLPHGYRLDLGSTRLRAVHAPLIGLGKLMGLKWF